MNSSKPDMQPNRILFVDPGWIESERNVTITTNPPLEQKIVLRADRPWESEAIAFFVSVLKEDGKYRMWYTCRDQHEGRYLAYAESQDGEVWVKPELGIVEYNGNTRNNLLDVQEIEGNVFIDPWAPPEAKYKYLTSTKKTSAEKGIYLYTSADGIHWRKEKEPYLHFISDSQAICFPDTRTGTYRIYLRGRTFQEDSLHARKRTVVYTETDDVMTPSEIKPREDSLYPWDAIRKPLITSELPTVFAPDAWEQDTVGFYTMAAVAYPPDPAYYVAFPALLSHQMGRTDVHVIGSRDGVNWQRYNRKPYWQPSVEPSDTQGMLFAGYGMFQEGQQLWHYGIGYRTNHGNRKVRDHDGAAVLLKQRLDGFVSADMDYRGGEFVTSPIVCTGNHLIVNLDTGGTGHARVAMLRENGEAVEGLTLEQCDPIRSNHVAYRVTWGGKADISAWMGTAVKLKVAAVSCKVYSLRFEDGEGDE